MENFIEFYCLYKYNQLKFEKNENLQSYKY